jgi:hypothetical protein
MPFISKRDNIISPVSVAVYEIFSPEQGKGKLVSIHEGI